MSDLEADKYNAQTYSQSESPYNKDTYKQLRGEVLSPSKYVGSTTEAYRTLDATGTTVRRA